MKTTALAVMLGSVLAFSQTSMAETKTYVRDATYNTTIFKIDKDAKSFEFYNVCRTSKTGKQKDFVVSIKGDYEDKTARIYGRMKEGTNLKISMQKPAKYTAQDILDDSRHNCTESENLLEYFDQQISKKIIFNFSLVDNELLNLIDIDNKTDHYNTQSIYHLKPLKEDSSFDVKKSAFFDFTRVLIGKMANEYHRQIIRGSAGGFTIDSGVGSGSWGGSEPDVADYNAFAKMLGGVSQDLIKKYEKSIYFSCAAAIQKKEKTVTVYTGLDDAFETKLAIELFDCLMPKLKLIGTNPFRTW